MEIVKDYFDTIKGSKVSIQTIDGKFIRSIYIIDCSVVEGEGWLRYKVEDQLGSPKLGIIRYESIESIMQE